MQKNKENFKKSYSKLKIMKKQEERKRGKKTKRSKKVKIQNFKKDAKVFQKALKLSNSK